MTKKDLMFHEKCLEVFHKTFDVFEKCLDVFEKRLEVLRKCFKRKIKLENVFFYSKNVNNIEKVLRINLLT
ncbi:MAG: hypothetical protein WCJ61_16765 [Paludibacter sp.]